MVAEAAGPALTCTGGGTHTVPAMPSIDLRALFKGLGGATGVRALESAPLERTRAEEDVTLLDSGPSKITAAPSAVDGFVDGIQASLCLRHVEHRPVYLSYVAAGSVGAGARPLGLLEDLVLIASELERGFLTDLGSGVPIVGIAAQDPPTLEREAQRLVGTRRDQLERQLVTQLLDGGCGALMVDGSLLGRANDARLIGVVKTTAHQWLDDESGLFGLREGWRSPRFVITERGGRQRYSCYVQMVDKSAGAWNLGLIRVEAFDPELLDGAAARALSERQGARGGDRRWDRHLASVRVTEEFLRARRPSVFALS